MTTQVTSPELSDLVLKNQKDRENNPDLFKGITLDIPWFKQRVPVIQKGWTMFIGGAPKSGKSTVISMLAIEAGKANIPSVYFTWEDTLLQTGQRVYANLGKISRIHFRDATITPEDNAKILQATDTFRNFPILWVVDCYTPSMVGAVLNSLPFVPEAVFFDYLQLMEVQGAKSQNEAVAEASRFMTQVSKGKFTKGKEVACMCTCQENDDGQPLYSRNPLRDADIYTRIGMVSDGNNGFMKGRRKLTLHLFRHGDAGDSVDLHFEPETNRMGEMMSSIGGLPQP